MPDNRVVPGSPEEWLARAKGDLALAEAPLPAGAFYEDLCFPAQQAAEKALKAIYVDRGWTFPYIHDLEKLLDGLQERSETSGIGRWGSAAYGLRLRGALSRPGRSHP